MTPQVLEAILACDDKGGISRGGKIPWHNAADIKYFKETTTAAEGESSLIMGRKTWESLPNKPLPNRENIVVSEIVDIAPNTVPTIYDARHIVLLNPGDRAFVIGGAQLLMSFLDDEILTEANLNIQKIHLTRIPGDWHCNVKIPLDKIKKSFYNKDIVDLGDCAVEILWRNP